MAVFAGHARVLFMQSLVQTIGLVTADVASTAAARTASTNTSFSHEAVIVFFVLSGYFVGGSVIRSLRKGVWSTRHYVILRMTRLWTVLIPALLMTALLDNIGISLFGTDGIYGGPIGQELVSKNLSEQSTVLTFISNLFFLQGLIFGPTFGTNTPLWTLAYEFWFYVTFPLIALAFRSNNSIVSRLTLLILSGAIIYALGNKFLFYFSIWMAGCAIEVLPPIRSNITAKIASILTGIVFVVVCVALVRLKPPILLSDLIVCLISSALVYSVANLTMQSPRSVFSSAATALSEMSYTLYLCHAPILVFIAALLMKTWQPWTVSLPTLINFSAVVFATLVVSYLMYRLFERNTPWVRKLLTKI